MEEIEQLCQDWYQVGNYEAVIDTVEILPLELQSATLTHLLQLSQKRVLASLYEQMTAVMEAIKPPLEEYRAEERAALEQHITQHYGPIATVISDDKPQDIKVDIWVIEPSAEHPFYTLITCGMGAHQMAVNQEQAAQHLQRAELIITLPSDWKLSPKFQQIQRWSWPLLVLKVTARMGLSSDWIVDPGFIINYNGPLAHNTRLSGWVVLGPDAMNIAAPVCSLPNGDKVNFYQLLPLYQNEVEYGIEHTGEELIAKLTEVSRVVDLTRPNALEPKEE